MLKINFSPVRADREQATAIWADPVLTVDGVEYDLSELNDGDSLVEPYEHLMEAGRTGDDYEVTISIYHGPNAAESTRFPVPLDVTSDGDIAVPEYNIPDVMADESLTEEEV